MCLMGGMFQMDALDGRNVQIHALDGRDMQMYELEWSLAAK